MASFNVKLLLFLHSQFAYQITLMKVTIHLRKIKWF